MGFDEAWSTSRPEVSSVLWAAFPNRQVSTKPGQLHHKSEVIRRNGPWRSLESVEYAKLEWVDWFNHRRLLEPIGYLPTHELERVTMRQPSPVTVTGLM